MSTHADLMSRSTQNVNRDGVDNTVCQVIVYIDQAALDAVVAEAQTRAAAGESTVVTATMMRALSLDHIVCELAGLTNGGG